MSKFYLVLSATMVLVFFSCKKTEHASNDAPQTTASEMGRHCATQEVFEQQLAADPTLRERMNKLEEFTNEYKQKARLNNRTTPIVIPVVVHVVSNTPEQDISAAQINAQMAVLNEDFAMQNADRTKVPPDFTGVQSAMNIEFRLERVIRVKTSKKSFGTNDGVKYSKQGGSDAVEPSKYLNIWVCNLGQNLLGYAQFPGGKPQTDGIVVLYSSFGNKEKNPEGTYIANYHLGRTATHEVGHWINLRHIWGDATCGNDFVGDTPPHRTSNTRCPAPLAVTCTSNSTTNPLGFKNEMTMNYMDYTYDGCMYMFTAGQKVRADAVFATGGPRAAMVSR